MVYSLFVLRISYQVTCPYARLTLFTHAEIVHNVSKEFLTSKNFNSWKFLTVIYAIYQFPVRKAEEKL